MWLTEMMLTGQAPASSQAMSVAAPVQKGRLLNLPTAISAVSSIATASTSKWIAPR